MCPRPTAGLRWAIPGNSPLTPKTKPIHCASWLAWILKPVGVEIPKRSSLKEGWRCAASGSAAKRLERGLDDRSSSPLANLA